MIENKKNNLIKYSLKTFQNKNLEDVQINARKALEAFCKIMIITYFGEKRGKAIIYSQDPEYNKIFKVSKKQKEKKQEFVLAMLARIITRESNMIRKCYENKYSEEKLEKVVKAYREYLKRYLDVLIFNGNASSHESNDVFLNQDDIFVVQKILSKLLHWLFLDFLNEKLPDELLPYIEKYDVFLSYRGSNIKWVEILKNNLESYGYKVFLDKYELIGGENYKRRLKYAIDNSKSAIVVISEDSVNSEWIQKELEWMKERQFDDSSFKIIPILIDRFIIPPTIEHIHCLDFTKKKYVDSFYNLICSLEGKAPKCLVEIDEKKLILPDKLKQAQKLQTPLNQTLINNLINSLQKNYSLIIIEKKENTVINELNFFMKKVKNYFSSIYHFTSPAITRSSYTKKLLADAGLEESDEEKYVNSLILQTNLKEYYHSSLTFKSFAKIIENQLIQNKRVLIIFNLDGNDQLYFDLFKEFYLLQFAYTNRLTLLVLTTRKNHNLEKIFTKIHYLL